MIPVEAFQFQIQAIARISGMLDRRSADITICMTVDQDSLRRHKEAEEQQRKSKIRAGGFPLPEDWSPRGMVGGR